MKHIKDFLFETLILTVAVIGWGILRLIRTVQQKAAAIQNPNEKQHNSYTNLRKNNRQI